jgi:hypothetical protein
VPIMHSHDRGDKAVHMVHKPKRRFAMTTILALCLALACSGIFFAVRNAPRDVSSSGGIPATSAGTGASAAGPGSSTTPGTCRNCKYWARFGRHFPTSQSFFPIGVWDQYAGSTLANNGAGSWAFRKGYRSLALAAKGAGINTFVGLSGWPARAGQDTAPTGGGFLQAACNAGEYVIAGGNPMSRTAPNSVRSVDKVANDEKQHGTRTSCARYLVGYEIGDEPDECTTNVPQQVRAIHAEDASRLAYEGMSSWMTWGQTGCNEKARADFAAPDIPASDDYHNIDPWDVRGCEAGADVSRKPWPDCSWLYGYQEAIQQIYGKGKPTNGIIEAGNNVYDFASEDGSRCSVRWNQCSNGNQYNATPPQVNSDAWASLLNGASMLMWFCDGAAHGQRFTYSNCLGGAGSASNAIFANLSYIDHTIEKYAVELNTVSSGACTMQPSTYATLGKAPATSCANGDLSLRTSNGREPVMGMTKKVGGKLYLFVEADRGNGATTATYKITGAAGSRATLVYDSAQRYDKADSEQGKTFTLSSSGQFSDSLRGDSGVGSNRYGAGANGYQVKIYEIT